MANEQVIVAASQRFVRNVRHPGVTHHWVKNVTHGD